MWIFKDEYSVTRKKHFSLFRFTLTFIQKKLKGTYPEFWWGQFWRFLLHFCFNGRISVLPCYRQNACSCVCVLGYAFSPSLISNHKSYTFFDLLFFFFFFFFCFNESLIFFHNGKRSVTELVFRHDVGLFCFNTNFPAEMFLEQGHRIK